MGVGGTWGHVTERTSPYFSPPDPPLPPTQSNNGAHEEEGPREEGHSHHGTPAPPFGEVLCRPAHHLYVLHDEAQREKNWSSCQNDETWPPYQRDGEEGVRAAV